MEQVRQNLTEGQAIDLFVAYRFLRILTTPWEDQEAFKLGIIDKDGKLLRKVNTLTKPEEKKAFTLLHRLVFNLKRILPRSYLLLCLPLNLLGGEGAPARAILLDNVKDYAMFT